MESCKGFENWLECLNCPHLCTNVCPIEGENVMDEMQKRISHIPLQDSHEKRNYFDR